MQATWHHGETREDREGDQGPQEATTTPEGELMIYPNAGHSCRRLQPCQSLHSFEPKCICPRLYLVTTEPEFSSSYHHHLCQNPQFPKVIAHLAVAIRKAQSCLWKLLLFSGILFSPFLKVLSLAEANHSPALTAF